MCCSRRESPRWAAEDFENNNGAELSINGQRGRSNNYQIDGQNNNDNTIGGSSFFFGNQDAIAELQVVTNYDAEYGRNMGGVVNYVTKNGTNAFHGTGFEFWQGDHFDSLQNQEKKLRLRFLRSGPNHRLRPAGYPAIRRKSVRRNFRRPHQA